MRPKVWRISEKFVRTQYSRCVNTPGNYPPPGHRARHFWIDPPPCAFAHVLDRHRSVVLLLSHRLVTESMRFLLLHMTHKRQSGKGRKGSQEGNLWDRYLDQ